MHIILTFSSTGRRLPIYSYELVAINFYTMVGAYGYRLVSWVGHKAAKPPNNISSLFRYELVGVMYVPTAVVLNLGLSLTLKKKLNLGTTSSYSIIRRLCNLVMVLSLEHGTSAPWVLRRASWGELGLGGWAWP
jgi:hypothetical protein